MPSKNPAAVALGKRGGKAGTGAAKSRATSFTSASAKAALAARWAKAKRKPKASARRSNVPVSDGWNGTKVEVGRTVKVWAENFGRGVQAVVCEINGGFAVVEIVKTAKRCAFAAGNKVTLGVWWLEAVA